MARLSRDQIAQRRSAVWEMHVRGVPYHTIASALGVHRNTIANDVRELRLEHRAEVKDIDVHAKLGDSVAKYDEIFKYAMQEYSQQNMNPRERAAFLDKALSSLDKKTRLLVETGVLPRAAQELTGKMIIEGVDLTKASLEELRTLRNRMVGQLDEFPSSSSSRITDKSKNN